MNQVYLLQDVLLIKSENISFKLASMDEFGVINIWIVLQLEEIDWGGSESDYGLSIGGKLKLIKSATIKLVNPIKEIESNGFRVFDIEFHLEDSNQ
jgi:hypothetical protein